MGSQGRSWTHSTALTSSVLPNLSQYPPLIVHALVDDETSKDSKSMLAGGESGQDIHEFKITEIKLRHRTEEPTRVIAIEHHDTA